MSDITMDSFAIQLLFKYELAASIAKSEPLQMVFLLGL